VTSPAKAVATTLTAAPVPVLGISGAGRLLSLVAMVISDSGMVLAPLASAVVAVARSVTWPALLRTSTGSTLPLGVMLKLGAAPLQFTEVLLPATGVVGTPGMDGASTKATLLVVPPGVGQVPSPMRKKMNLSMAMVKSRFTEVLSGTSRLGPVVLDAACTVWPRPPNAMDRASHAIGLVAITSVPHRS